MPDSRLLRILSRLRVEDDLGSGPASRLCDVCVEVVDVDGAGIMLMSGGVTHGSVCSSNDVSTQIEDLQYTLGEGPCVDACLLDRPVLEPDLANPVRERWPAFTPPAIEAGVGAVFGFPMQVGGVRLGAINLYSARPGALSDDQHADALVVAGIAARSVLAMQAHAEPGTLGGVLEAGADFRLVVHQAAGMLSAQLQTTVAEALVRLRAYAFVEGRDLVKVAEDVVARRLRID